MAIKTKIKTKTKICGMIRKEEWQSKQKSKPEPIFAE
jgi:hypothetical protein